MARSSYLTIPDSTLTEGISDIVYPISTKVQLTFTKLLKEIQKLTDSNKSSNDILNSYNTQLYRIADLLIGYKKRLLDIKLTLNVEQEYDLDKFKIPEVNKKTEFLTQSSINNFDIKLMIDTTLEYVERLETKIKALTNEINANININSSSSIPSTAPKSVETLLLGDNIYTVNFNEVFNGLIKNDINTIAAFLFEDFDVLNAFLKLNNTDRERFSKRFYLTLEQCLVAAFIAGIGKKLPQDYLLSKTGLSVDIISKYSLPNINLLKDTNKVSDTDNIQEIIETQKFTSPEGREYTLEILRFDRYQLAPIFVGIAKDKNNHIKFKTDETFSNSTSILLNELKFKINYNIY